jgi:hypothetical protein
MPRLRPPPHAEIERQKSLWEGLNEFITRSGGWVVSPRDVSPVRFEIRAGSDLPSALRQLGYEIRNAGINERCLPIMSEHGRNQKTQREQIGLVPVEIYEFIIPI